MLLIFIVMSTALGRFLLNFDWNVSEVAEIILTRLSDFLWTGGSWLRKGGGDTIP